MVKALTDDSGSLGPNPLALTKTGIEFAPLADPCADRARTDAKGASRSLDFRSELFADGLHVRDDSEKFLTVQVETSHSHMTGQPPMTFIMEIDETFRRRLRQLRLERGYSAAELSRRAKLNVRAVTDIEDGKAQSPKISTAFALAEALGVDPGEMLGLGPRLSLRAELAQFLSQYDEAQQERILAALLALPMRPAE